MTTINISLPHKLREEVQLLIDHGLYASVSDLIRDGIRTVVAQNKHKIEQSPQSDQVLQHGVKNEEFLKVLKQFKGPIVDPNDYSTIHEELKKREYWD